MGNIFSNGCSIFTNPLRFSVRNIEDIIIKASGQASLKDVSGKYLLTNEYETQLSGFTPNEFKGLTIEDISERIKFLKGSKQRFVDTIKKIDSQVRVSQCPVFIKEIFITHNGFIKVRNLIKSPIIGQDNKVIAIFAHDEDLTPRLNLFDLFELYKKFYIQKEAISRFLDYFNVKSFFQEMPSHTETLVIIAMAYDSRHKEVAKLLKQTPRTVAAHSSSLHQKLKQGAELYTISSTIRNADRNTCSVEDWLVN